MSGADLNLFDWYLHGDGQYIDISAWCGDYLADPAVQLVASSLKTRAKRKAQELVGMVGSVDWRHEQRDALYVTTIYSFANSSHDSQVSCRFTGDGCCVTGECSTNFRAKDLFTDPYDLHQRWGLPMWLANNGVPFWFGLSCDGGSFSVTECRH